MKNRFIRERAGQKVTWQVTGDTNSSTSSPATRHASLGASAFPTAKPFHSPTEISDHNNSWPERILATLSSGGDDDVPAYQLACVVDDAAMQITEVVRGADLLVSTARQILLYRALGLTPPAVFSLPADAGRNRRAAGQASRRLEFADVARPRRNARIIAPKRLLIPRPARKFSKNACEFFHDKAISPVFQARNPV